MSRITIDPFDRNLAVTDSYEDKERCQTAGCFWDGTSKTWKMSFTIATFERLIENLPHADIDPSVTLALEEQAEKEKKLKEIRDLTKKNQNINFRIPGLKVTPFPFQKLGILYAVTNQQGMLFGDSMGLGKAMPVDSQVFSLAGKVRIGDLKVGDKVVGRDGEEHNVIGVYPQGLREVCRITFSDGFSIVVDTDHLWYVCSNSQNSKRNKDKDIGVVLSTKQLLDVNGKSTRHGTGHNSDKVYEFSTYYKKDNGDNSWCIPVVKPIRFNPKETSIDPYTLGVFIGNGCIHKDGYIAVKKELVELGLNGKRSWERFIPSCYKYNSVDVRLGVLQGLMDTDGCAGDYSTEYCTVSKTLCDDVAEIIQTLGGIARISTKTPTYTYKGVKKQGRTAYRVNIKLPPEMELFRLKRKKEVYDKCNKCLPARYISNIEKLPEKQETVCIAVDAPDHLYVTEHCIVTHNTIQGIATAIVLKNQGKIKNCLVITPASLKFNWPLEIEKFSDEKSIVIDSKKPEDRIRQWLDDSAFFKIANYELVVEDLGAGREIKIKKSMTAEEREKAMLRKLHKLVKQKRLESIKDRVWDLVIMDEVHAIKHNGSKRYQALKNIKARIKIGLSGTPMDGRLEELFNVLNIICPGVLGSRESFFKDHMVTDIFGTVKGYKKLLEVQEKIAPFFIRRLKKDVLKDLPEKLYENKVISLSDEEMKIYKMIKAGKHPCVIDNQNGQPCSAMVRAIRCMQFINFPQMLEPNCKKTTKIDVFRDVLEELIKDNGQKIIIFTQFKRLLDIVDKILKEMNLKFLRIDGDTDKKNRTDYQKIFNEDMSVDAIIGTDAMSTGLNLIGGDTVLNLTQSWQPAIMSQREDRSYRIGRKGNVTVLNFLCKDTIEERIRSTLYSKDKITSDTLGDGTDEAVLLKMNPEEIEKLM
ncbi:MAG: SNF2-related protein [Paludibacteraceae bacterium]|nr:SNF2-related protein [Paludibacteraceae bacterium]